MKRLPREDGPTEHDLMFDLDEETHQFILDNSMIKMKGLVSPEMYGYLQRLRELDKIRRKNLSSGAILAKANRKNEYNHEVIAGE